MKVIDLFCGAGGFSEGFRQAGFEVIWAVDNWESAQITHQANHPESNTILGDVEKLSRLPDDEFHRTIPDADIIIGSPPCVDFSNSNKSGKGDKSKGIKLIEAYLRIVYRKMWKEGSILQYWLLENVPKSMPYIKPWYTAQDLGLTGAEILQVTTTMRENAKHFGVPSNRERFICGHFPKPEQIINDEDDFITLQYVQEHLGAPKERLDTTISDPIYDFEMNSKMVTDHHYIHELAEHQWSQAKRLKEDKGYMGRMEFPEDVTRPARTVMATMTFGARESMILGWGKDKYRAPTIREVASLMSFPIDYKFFGQSVGLKYKLVGNAVPPKLAYALAKAIADEHESSVPENYSLIQHRNGVEFYDLNFRTILVQEEKPKRPKAKFKYHIPYLILDRFRVELTNHNSNFEDLQFIWNVEIPAIPGLRRK